MARTMILPAAEKEYERLLRTLCQAKEAGVRQGNAAVKKQAAELGALLEGCHAACAALAKALTGKHEEILEAMTGLRKSVDELEKILPDDLWPVPKYREMLFIM